ncbi:histone-lysine N-methyltransferase, H3 lysine-9 specific SUVH5-like isoform X1 [Diospyros lotus]|uniref:histone-lysine N-methyltransferase, H3 lysine-9 specific SUVH5-like isoform X1 n=1 Tax=Diospyros lotus TaxID=55363 RepID=UPI0022588FE6|nr:histone-lysine N-methyltransferase, H3 lysine-9 specific SUVH5-like isoform X1 [Diospyros lotus]
MNLLTDRNCSKPLVRRRTSDHGGCRFIGGFPPNFKGPKVDAIRDFPRNCGSPASRRTAAMPRDVNSEPPKPLRRDGTVQTPDHGEKVLRKAQYEPQLIHISEKRAQGKPNNDLDTSRSLSQSCQLVGNYPAPKIREGVPVFCDYPRRCGMLNPRPKSKVLAKKSTMDQRPLVMTRRADREQKSNGLAIVPSVNVQTVFHQNKVKEALDLFEEAFKKLVEENEAQAKGKGGSARMVLLKAAMRLKERRKWVNTAKLLGAVPGVEVGDRFRFRVELVVIGLHRQFQGGIDYTKKDGKVVATSIVASGRYANDAKSADVLTYCGQGGNPSVADKKPEDQKLKRGNLALKNSMDEGTPVRVIRRRETLKTPSILGARSGRNYAYVYDGLYAVTNCRQQRGPYGKLVFMFRLNRIPGQPKLGRF